MKTRQLNLEDFKENQLPKKQLKSISGGEEWVYDPRTNSWNYYPSPISPIDGGSGDGNGDSKGTRP